MTIYRLVGYPGMTPGTIVDMGPIGHRYGRILKETKKNYELPDPCVMTGPVKAKASQGLCFLVCEYM